MVKGSAEGWAGGSFVSAETVRILIAQTSFLGDVVLTTPLMPALRLKYPEARFSWVTTPEAAPLLGSDPWIERVISFDKNRSERSFAALLRKAGEIRALNFDLAFGVQRSFRTSVLLALSGIKERIGFAQSRCAFLYSRRVQRVTSANHEVVRNLSLLSDQSSHPLRIVAAPQAPQGELKWGVGQVELDPTRCVVLGVGSAWATKRWTLGGFVAVAKWVVARGLTPVLLGGAADQARAEIIEEECPGCINLALALEQSVQFVSRCAAVVCHDSMLLHLASAFSRPTVTIFCSTVPEFGFGPWLNPNAQIVQTNGLSCRPCGRHGHQMCPTGTWACAIDISPTQVINALESVLSGTA